MSFLGKLLKSLLLPAFFAGLIPIFILFFIECRTISTLFTNMLFLAISGIVLFSSGFTLFIYCNLLFIRIGKGTLMPLKDLETKHLVIKGPYKYVRNPMINAVILMIIAEGFIFDSFIILIYAFIFFLINVIYIPLREEKYMEKRFNGEFIEYKQNVRRWIPNFKPYEKLEGENVPLPN